MGVALPAKEQSIFKTVVKLYETKQYKKALKSADSILKKFPNHGETLAMKGLTLNSLERKAEAYELVRDGLKNDLRSHVCWHVYGLLYRSDRKYHDAAKAYLQALKIDTDNAQILRDLALLQVQIRDYEGFEATRRNLLTLKPSLKVNWLGFALAHHLIGNFETAISVLDAYNGTLSDSTTTDMEEAYENSELLLYKAFVLEESGSPEKAVTHLEENRERIVDKLAWREARVRNLVKLKRNQEAKEEIRRLISINPENHEYHRQLHDVACQEQSAPGDKAALAIKLCDEMKQEFPRALACRRIPLDIIVDGSAPDFSFRLDDYVRGFLLKGIPSLFSDLKSLYDSRSKAKAIGVLFERFQESLLTTGNLPAASGESSNALKGDPSEGQNPAGALEDSPSTLLWVQHFLGQHYNRVGQTEKALLVLEKAMAHTPTLVELYLAKAKVLSDAGDRGGSLAVSDEARRMDLADRYLNSKSAKYAMRADMVEQAEAWIALFTRDGDSGGVQALYDMQCMWYEIEAGESYFRQGKLSLALKKFTAVDRHFADIVEDQFDFHTYCLRKVTLTAYVGLLRMEDTIRGHDYYRRAALGMIKIFLVLHDNPRKGDASAAALDAELASMSVSERKKALSKIRKAGARAAQAGPKLGTNDSEDAKGGGPQSKKGKGLANKTLGWMETDPEGMELLESIKNPLEEANKHVKNLSSFADSDVQTHVLAYDVYMRKQRYLLALRAVCRARAVAPLSPKTFLLECKLMKWASDEVMADLPKEISEVFRRQTDAFLKPLDIQAKAIEKLESCDRDVETRVTAAIVLFAVVDDPIAKAKAFTTIEALVEDCPDMTAKEAERFVGELVLAKIPAETVDRLRAACKVRYPRSTTFAGGTAFPVPSKEDGEVAG